MLDAQLHSLNAGEYGLTNLLLHIANTLLLFGLLHRMTGWLGRSAFVAGLFAVHPLHVQSVAWGAERKAVLSTLLPVIGLVQVGGQAMADRYTYVPLIGLFLMLGWGIPEYLAHWSSRTIAMPIAAGVFLLGCAVSARA